jgi:hypothetical protein
MWLNVVQCGTPLALMSHSGKVPIGTGSKNMDSK